MKVKGGLDLFLFNLERHAVGAVAGQTGDGPGAAHTGDCLLTEKVTEGPIQDLWIRGAGLAAEQGGRIGAAYLYDEIDGVGRE
jgi:hypothetical protein